MTGTLSFHLVPCTRILLALRLTLAFSGAPWNVPVSVLLSAGLFCHHYWLYSKQDGLSCKQQEVVSTNVLVSLNSGFVRGEMDLLFLWNTKVDKVNDQAQIFRLNNSSADRH